MIQAINRLLICLLLLTVLPLQAQLKTGLESRPESDEIAMVQVVTRGPDIDNCLAPVAIFKIDGEKRLLPAHGFLIEEGIHSINGRATLDISACPLRDGNLQLGPAADLLVNFEKGNTYYIAYDHGALNSDEWKLVVWKVEQSIETGEGPDSLLEELTPLEDWFQ